MAYSLSENPKLTKTRSTKFYPEEYSRPPVSFRHKSVPPHFDPSMERYAYPPMPSKHNKGDQSSMKARMSTDKKCPIYVHNFRRSEHTRPSNNLEEGDFAPHASTHKNVKHKRSSQNDSKHSSVINKLEESYWATWKPDKKDQRFSGSKLVSEKFPMLRDLRHKIKVHPVESSDEPLDESELEVKTQVRSTQHVVEKPIEETIGKPIEELVMKPVERFVEEPVKEDSMKSQEIQTDSLPMILPPKSEKKEMITKETDTGDIVLDDEQILEACKPLQHTDSFILTYKKQTVEKEHFDQPKCIRLYKKPDRMTSRSYVKGGSYPLKSCLKKESSFVKGNIRLGRPGSPLIVSSNFASKHRHFKA